MPCRDSSLRCAQILPYCAVPHKHRTMVDLSQNDKRRTVLGQAKLGQQLGLGSQYAPGCGYGFVVPLHGSGQSGTRRRILSHQFGQHTLTLGPLDRVVALVRHCAGNVQVPWAVGHQSMKMLDEDVGTRLCLEMNAFS